MSLDALIHITPTVIIISPTATFLAPLLLLLAMQTPTIRLIPCCPDAVLTDEEYKKCMTYYIKRGPGRVWISEEVQPPELLWTTFYPPTIAEATSAAPGADAVQGWGDLPRWRDQFIPRSTPPSIAQVAPGSTEGRLSSSVVATATATAGGRPSVVIISDDDDHADGMAHDATSSPSFLVQLHAPHSCTGSRAAKAASPKIAARSGRRQAVPQKSSTSTVVQLNASGKKSTAEPCKKATVLGAGVKRQRSMDEFFHLD